MGWPTYAYKLDDQAHIYIPISLCNRPTNQVTGEDSHHDHQFREVEKVEVKTLSGMSNHRVGVHSIRKGRHRKLVFHVMRGAV
jgi:hypothetical protein